MLDDRLLTLIDHPPQDAEPPRNPVLTHQVMERVRHDYAQAQASAQANARAERHDGRPWALGALLVCALALLAPSTGMLSDGGLSEAASLFDAELLLELVIGAVIAAGILALSWRRLV